MAKKFYIILYFAALIYFLPFVFWQKTTGYMDASYYYITGQQIVIGRGATEPFLWNYLNSPQALPNPAFTYWMPLPAFLAALGMWVLRSTSFIAARIPFVLLVAFIPLLTVYFTSRVTHKRIYLLLAALFSLFCGSYLPFLTITETFLPFFILGAIYFIVAERIYSSPVETKNAWMMYGVLGIVAGLMHLTRADGILWLFGGLLIIWMTRRKHAENKRPTVANLASLALGYLVIMSGWFGRNLALFGSLFPPGSSLAMWFTNYNDLFMYPASILNSAYLIASGMPNILKARGLAALNNLGSLFGVVGNVVLFPFMAIGLWKSHKEKLTQFGLIMIGLLFCLMTLVFPYAGYRGGFFHSMSSFLVFLWAMAIIGVETVVQWSVTQLKWVEKKSRILFSVVITLGIIGMSVAICVLKIGISPPGNVWDSLYRHDQIVDAFIRGNLNDLGSPVMINDAPTYFAATGRTTYQLTSGSIERVVELMKKFSIGYLVIDVNVPKSLEDLYLHPGDQQNLRLIDSDNTDDFYIYGLNQR